MKLYLINAENIYFPQIKEYFREIISSYDNGNYRSSMVMLYSTIVCDLLLKLRELSDVYSDTKAEKILEDINKQRKNANSSSWEWNLIKKIREQTELLNDESYAMLEHIYSLRNFSAHPALNEDYELISPTPEMTVAYIKKALEDILIKPSVFAQNIVDRMSNDIAERKEIYKNDFNSFKVFLHRVYFQRMSEKMVLQVFKAFWKFTFRRAEGAQFIENRLANRKTLEAILDQYGDAVCKFVKENQSFFTVSTSETCLKHVCVLLSYYPQIYGQLEATTQYQIQNFNADACNILKWFVGGDLEQYLATYITHKDSIPTNVLDILKRVCEKQGLPGQFPRMLIRHYSRSSNYISARNRFDGCISEYLSVFSATDFIELIAVINNNDQIHGYGGQRERNNKIMEFATPLLPEGFAFENYPNFRFTKPEVELQDETEPSAEANEIVADEEIPF